MMIEGRLRWSRDRDGSWYTSAHDDEYRLYTAKRNNGGWIAFAQGRFSDTPPQFLGWYTYLKDAKLAVDRHHHFEISQSDNQNWKDYIERYPL
jgi:hypothetical protein